MSSSPPTEVTTVTRPAGWNPAGWPLRTRLIAIVIGLLVLLGLVVGATAETFLHKSLYQQLDTKLKETNAHNRPRDLGGRPSFNNDKPPPGSEADWIVLRL